MIVISHKLKNLRFSSAIALALTFLVALSCLWSLHTDSPTSLNSAINSSSDRSLDNSDPYQWQQPLAISDRYPEPISINNWQFDYEATEQVLQKIKQNKSGKLILNANTARVLEEAVSTLPPLMKQDELRRVEFLVTKGLSGSAGQQLASIFTQFYHYQHALNLANSTVKNQEETFTRTVLLQKEYLGEDVSELFFGQQNRLNNYLLARKAINEDSSLNSVQKQQELIILQNRFKANED